MGPMPLAASTLWWMDEPLTADHLRQMANAGVEAVELTDYHPNFNYLRATWLREIRDVVEGSGMVVGSVHTHFRWCDPALDLVQADPVRRRRAVEVYLRGVDALSMLGHPVLLTHDIRLPDQGDPQYATVRAGCVEALREIAAYAEPAGIRVAIENMTRGWSTDPGRLLDLADEAGHPGIGLCIDVAHAYVAHDPVGAIRVGGSRALILHVNDAGPGPEAHVLPGRGAIDWAGVMGALRAAGCACPFTYELEAAADLPLVRENYARLLEYR